MSTIKERRELGEMSPDTTVALIYRTNAQSRALEEACVKYNVPFVMFGTATTFYKRQEIKDVLCFLRWIYNGRDRGSMLRAMVTPKRGIGEAAIREFEEYCAHIESQCQNKETIVPDPLTVLLSLSGSTEFDDKMTFEPTGFIKKRSLRLFTEFSAQIRNIRDRALSHRLSDVLAFVVSEVNLHPHLDKVSKTTLEFEERKANVEELRQAAERHSSDGPCLETTIDADGMCVSPLGAFLDEVALVTDVTDSLKDSADRFVVSLMTIHASKGMEFDMVFVVGNEDGTLPTHQAIQAGEGSVVLEEEKRLCYVAMTRAKTELVMTWRREVPVFTSNGISHVEKSRSRFLNVLVPSKKAKEYANPNPELNIPRSLMGRQVGRLGGTRSITGSAISTTTERGVNPAQHLSPPFLSESSTEDPGSKITTQSAKVEGLSKAIPEKQLKKKNPLDSTWFFPVGSEVVHKKMGKGTVMPPPQSDSLLVRVQFDNGKDMEFPAQATDLSPLV